MKILGIETSCDETAAAVVLNGREILSNVVVSQIDIFKEYGGVIPEVAARSHLEVILPVINKALNDAGCSWDDIDAVAVTHAPGLLGSLLIGTLTARTLAILHNKPLYPIHHLKSHIYANWIRENNSKENNDRENKVLSTDSQLSEIQFPLLALVISGGHTQILYMREHNHFEIIGTTNDDAVGECFDKVAKILGLPYPGGPAIAKAASGDLLRVEDDYARKAERKIRTGNDKRYILPHPKVPELDFSFSGLKTAVLRAVQKEVGVPISFPSHKLKDLLTEEQVRDFSASFQKTAVEILLEKLALALKEHPEVETVVFAGGVSANQELRKQAEEFLKRGVSFTGATKELKVYFPEPKLSGDNGAMVAAAAYYEILSGVRPADPYKVNIYPRVSIEDEG